MYTCTLYENIVDKSFYFKKRTYMRKIVAKRVHVLQKNESETEKQMFIKYIVDHDRPCRLHCMKIDGNIYQCCK